MGEKVDEGLVVVVFGATGAVGRDLVRALQKAPFPVRALRLVGGKAPKDREIEVEETTFPVTPMPANLMGHAVIAGADLVFLATPPEVSRELGPALAAQGLAVVDIGGALGDQAPLAVPGVGADGQEGFEARRLICSPHPVVVALATLLAPLAELGLVSARGTALISAGLAGQAGVEELSGQVAALFNAGVPPRKVFPGGLAFDVVTPVGAVPPDGQGWSDLERQLAVQTAALVGLEPHQLALTVALVPVFAGVTLSLFVELEDERAVSEVLSVLEGAPGVRAADPVPGPRRLAGRAGLYVGRVRPDPAGRGVHLWAAADNLRFGASANALAIATELWRRGRV